MTTMQEPRYASPVDYDAYGEYGPGRGFERGQAFQRPRYRFQGRYARDLYQHPAFGETTDFAAFGGLLAGPAPSFMNNASWRIDVEPAQAGWDAPHHRETLTS